MARMFLNIPDPRCEGKTISSTEGIKRVVNELIADENAAGIKKLSSDIVDLYAETKSEKLAPLAVAAYATLRQDDDAHVLAHAREMMEWAANQKPGQNPLDKLVSVLPNPNQIRELLPRFNKDAEKRAITARNLFPTDGEMINQNKTDMTVSQTRKPEPEKVPQVHQQAGQPKKSQ